MPENFKDLLGVFALLISVGGTLYAWLTRSGKEAGEKVAKIEERLNLVVAERDKKIDVVEDRISRVEGELRGVPDRDSVHKMQLEMVAMRGSLDVLNERLIPLAAISGRLQEFLLDQAKGH